jgi:uncharacterized membrane protein YkoI
MKTSNALIVIAAAFACLPAFAGEKMHSSIQVPFVKGTPDAKEEVNTPRLLKLAKITKDQAKAIAAKKYTGKFKTVDLENEDGNLIWSVEIGKHELAIDAGDGNILSVE